MLTKQTLRTVGRNITMLREMRDMTQVQLGKHLGVSDRTISAWENGTNDMGTIRLAEVSWLFGVTPTILMEEDGHLRVDPTTLKLREPLFESGAHTAGTVAPLVGSIAAGDPTEAIARDGERAWVDPDVLSMHPSGFFLTVRGDSMDRVLPEGALAFVDPDVEAVHGDIAVVNVNGEDATIKRLYVAGDTIVLHPESTNPEHRDRAIDERDPDAPRVRVIGKVVWLAFPANVRL